MDQYIFSWESDPYPHFSGWAAFAGGQLILQADSLRELLDLLNSVTYLPIPFVLDYRPPEFSPTLFLL